MIAKIVRVLRTPYSERFVLQEKAGGDLAALDLHYFADGKVAGTLIIFDHAKISDESIPTILKKIDEELLPDVSIADGNLTFTVVQGRVVGSFVPHPHESNK